MKWKEFAADYLSFTRRDRIGILFLLILIIGIFLLPKVISTKGHTTPSMIDTAWMAALKKLEQKENNNKRNYTNYNEENSVAYENDRPAKKYTSKTKGELFYFDPNSLSAAGWQRLGLRDKTISIIQNYLNKGGKFRNPEDLQRIYGLFPNEFERIAPFIKIEKNSEEQLTFLALLY